MLGICLAMHQLCSGVLHVRPKDVGDQVLGREHTIFVPKVKTCFNLKNGLKDLKSLAVVLLVIFCVF